jgi:hypothetical protein
MLRARTHAMARIHFVFAGTTQGGGAFNRNQTTTGFRPQTTGAFGNRGFGSPAPAPAPAPFRAAGNAFGQTAGAFGTSTLNRAATGTSPFGAAKPFAPAGSPFGAPQAAGTCP